ncbi:MAG: anti-sigma factor antagonist [Spirochaetales bacterium]|nr:anti-sigma factor antagonist [Spirochaetales bacterium]
MNNDIIPGFDENKDESLKIRLEKFGDGNRVMAFHLHGYIDTYNSNNFQNRIGKAIESGYMKLIFECGGLNYVSSTGIGSFTAFLKSVKPAGGDIVLIDIQPKVYEVFQLLGFSQFFNIKDSLADAVAFFNAGDVSKKSETFPKIVSCPSCSKKLKVLKPGRFRCSVCRTIIVVNKKGALSLNHDHVL